MVEDSSRSKGLLCQGRLLPVSKNLLKTADDKKRKRKSPTPKQTKKGKLVVETRSGSNRRKGQVKERNVVEVRNEGKKKSTLNEGEKTPSMQTDARSVFEA